MNQRNFFAELKRRNVYKVAVAYAVVGWLIAQIATQIFPFLEIPNWIVRLVIDPFALALLGQAYARAGRRDEANKILARLNQETKERYVSAYGVGLVFLGMGDKNRAMDELERAYRENDGGEIYNIRIDPM